MYPKPLLIILFIYSFFSISAQNWEAQATDLLPANYGVFSVSVVDEMTVWAVAFDQTLGNNIPNDHISKVIKTIDGGVNWEVFDIDEAPGRISFDIVAHSSEVAYITTQDYGNGNGRGVFKTEDGGASWNLIYNNVAGGVWIRFFDEMEGIVINRSSMARTTDGGASWNTVPFNEIPAFANDEFTIIASGNNSCIVLGNDIWFGTNKGRVYHSIDRGISWSASNTSLGSNALILSVAFRDSLHGIALNASTLFTQFSVTEDGGSTWTDQNSSSGITVDHIISIPGADSTLIATSSQYTNISNRISAYSSDFGKNWETIDTSVPYGGTHFVETNVGWSSRGRIFNISEPAMYKWAEDFFVDIDNPLYTETKIYPNPFNHNINIESPHELQYQLMDIEGRILKSGTTVQQSTINYLQHLTAGSYLLQLNDGKHQVNYQLIKPQ